MDGSDAVAARRRATVEGRAEHAGAAVEAEPHPAGADAAIAEAVIPRATYRLQLHHAFDFDAAGAVLPYLQRLGISHVYCSPITRARPGSLHGYDVVDHGQISPELGGQAGFLRFAAAARALGLGLLLDQVPNHMGVFGTDNPWWMDVLENGPASEYAGWFDIDWHPWSPALADKLLVPVLGAAYGEVLDAGEIVLSADLNAATLALDYHEHRFPLDPRTYSGVLEAAARAPGLDEEVVRWLVEQAAAFAALPWRDVSTDDGRAERRAAQHAARLALAQGLKSRRGAAGGLLAAIDAINAEPGRDQLHALHEAQAYRLADWRMAADEINYRRFFDINELAALRIDDERVFEAVQGPALELTALGLADGLRIDHPDGLLDPAAYFERLQRGYVRRRRLSEDLVAARPLYVVSEKIVAPHEELPRGWALHGTTGYRFASLANGLFVERRNAERMERIWRAATSTSQAYADIAQDCKRLIARSAMASQLTTLAHALQRIALADRRTRDYGFNTLRDALAEVAAAMPVYRTYVVDTPSAQDRKYIDWAIARARKRGGPVFPVLFEFIRRCLLAQAPDGSPGSGTFATAFQQFCAPVAAKGIEDTAFYRYHRLVSLNEVGSDPAQFGVSAAAFHASMRETQAHWPHTMLATSTHDNKRSEDVRCRIDVLSEQPGAWRLALRRWRTLTRSWRSDVDDEPAPSAADQILLHQTLLGTLPAGGLDAAELEGFRDRIERYMLKASREAKQRTRWVLPDAAYEAALTTFVRGLLGRVEGNPALAEVQAHAERLAWFGALNSLALTVLKLTAPGVPDIYQGNEVVDLSLVDPDNRRPVDYARRAALLDELARIAALTDPLPELSALGATPADGRLKLWLTWRLLQLRREQPELFAGGRYVALRVVGSRRRNAIGYARCNAKAALVVAVGRKFAGLGVEPGKPPIGQAVWADTELRWPDRVPTRATDVLSGRELAFDGRSVALARVFDPWPLAVLLATY
jgi:(1->4)-alpha-D-glucan 1-alpha-D-glucosylmutase